MKVGVDARSLTAGRGVARFTRRMLDALAAAHPEDEWRLLERRPRAVFAAAALTGRPTLDGMLGGGLDVVWLPAPAPVAVSRGVPYVLTVHDLSFEQRPRDFTPYERVWHRAARPRALARRAARALCDSAATRDAMRAAWGVDGIVVAPGFDRPPAGAAPARPTALPGPYLLAVGALEPRKAPELLARAFARARAQGLQAELVFAGAGRLQDEVRGDGVHVLGTVADAELQALYAHALAVVMPSWLEGFGLPPLEAAAHGTPAVVSDLPVFTETLGADGALRFPPGDEAALAGALLRIAGDEALRARLAAAARAAGAPLTWERAAAQTYAALREAAAR